jgi:hypothetical protein
VNDRETAEEKFHALFVKAKSLGEKFGIELCIPRRAGKMRHRANYESNTPEEYFRASIYVPYMDSLLSALKARFCEANDIITSLSYLLPHEAVVTDKDEYMENMAKIEAFYDIDNFCSQAETWFEFQRSKPQPIQFAGVLETLEETTYYPAVKQALYMYITLPATTCTVERSFSTLRRVKTWLRSTMTDDRVSALCMMSVHREKRSAKKKTSSSNKLLTNLEVIAGGCSFCLQSEH